MGGDGRYDLGLVGGPCGGGVLGRRGVHAALNLSQHEIEDEPDKKEIFICMYIIRVEPSNESPAAGANIFGHLAIRVPAQVQQQPDEIFATAATQRRDKLQNIQ